MSVRLPDHPGSDVLGTALQDMLFICIPLTLVLWYIYLSEVLLWIMLLCLAALRKDMIFKYQINRIDIQSIRYLLKAEVGRNFFH